jgi:hypothetical protein
LSRRLPPNKSAAAPFAYRRRQDNPLEIHKSETGAGKVRKHFNADFFQAIKSFMDMLLEQSAIAELSRMAMPS